MLSSTMKSQGQSFLRSIISQILEDEKTINTESELKDLFSIFKSVLDGNKYLTSSLALKDFEARLPISKNEIERYIYYSLPAITIDNEDSFKEEIDSSMKRLIDLTIAERKAKKYEEQRQENKKIEELKPVEEAKPILQQLYYPEQNPSIPYPELCQQPQQMQPQMFQQPQQIQPQVFPQTYPTQEEEFDENADFTLQDIIDGRLVIRPTDSLEVARKKLALADGKTIRFANGIFNNQFTTPQQNEVQVEEVNQNDSEYDRVNKIFNAFKCNINKDSSYEDKEKYISERGMLYNSVYKDDTSKYLVEDKKNAVMLGLQAICTIMGEDINSINCSSNKQLLSDLGKFLVENINKENIDRAIECVKLFEGYVLNEIKNMQP
ncbi:MAG: hypothetical protein ACLR5O_00055 [Romboutsia timonensis]|uniref:hypothetical protein n=1 Tax=Romboutsia timonensis TaxID=1776391 RepID=UPI0039A03C1F